MNSRALVIGVNDYPDTTSQDPLLGAVADAIDFALWALNPLGGGVGPDQLYFWVHKQPEQLPPEIEKYGKPDRPWPSPNRPDFAVAPNKQAVVLAATNAADLAAGSGEEERLYVYLAGHGVVIKPLGYGSNSQSCLVASDYISGNSYGLVPLDDLLRLLEDRGPKESLLMFDCCRNKLPPTIDMPGLDIGISLPIDLNEQWMVGKATQETQDDSIAFETTDAPVRGAFTKMLVQGLRQYRVNGELTSEDLKGFVRKGVKKLVEPKRQVPDIKTRFDEDPYIVATGVPIGELPELRLDFPGGQAGDVRILDTNDRPIGVPIPIVNSSIAILIEPGQYTIEHVASGASRTLFHFGPEPTRADF